MTICYWLYKPSIDPYKCPDGGQSYCLHFFPAPLQALLPLLSPPPSHTTSLCNDIASKAYTYNDESANNPITIKMQKF